MNSFKKGDIVKYIWPRPNTKPNLGKILLDNKPLKNSRSSSKSFVGFA